MARVEIELSEEDLAELRELFGVETDAEAVAAAVVEMSKLQRRRAFSEAVKSGEIDFMPDVKQQDHPGQESSAA